MKYKFILFSPWLLKKPRKLRVLGVRAWAGSRLKTACEKIRSKSPARYEVGFILPFL